MFVLLTVEGVKEDVRVLLLLLMPMSRPISATAGPTTQGGCSEISRGRFVALREASTVPLLLLSGMAHYGYGVLW